MERGSGEGEALRRCTSPQCSGQGRTDSPRKLCSRGWRWWGGARRGSGSRRYCWGRRTRRLPTGRGPTVHTTSHDEIFHIVFNQVLEVEAAGCAPKQILNSPTVEPYEKEREVERELLGFRSKKTACVEKQVGCLTATLDRR